MARRRKKLSQPDIDMDLTPMIDMIFLLIIFFILAGKITAEISSEKITVPPTKTNQEKPELGEWLMVKVEVYGSTQEQGGGKLPQHNIKIGLRPPFVSRGATGPEAFTAYQQLRQVLDDYYDRASHYDDPLGTGLKLPRIIIELRADADTEYRVVQEIQQVASDSISPFPDAQGNFMTPKDHSKNMAGARPFVNFHFTTRKPGE